MTTAEPSMIRTALELSGTVLYALTAMIIVFGLLVVGISLRGPQKN